MTQNLLSDTAGAAGAQASTDPAAANGPAPAGTPTRVPDQVPEKFRDPRTGELRVDLLLRSYLELERKMRSMVEVPANAADPASARAFYRALGVPESPEGYRVALPEGAPVTVDPDVNRRLHAAGFTPQQVQLVYELAQEKMIPAIEDLAAAFEAERQLDALIDHFGGEEKWQEVAKTLTAWGKKTLGPTVFEALSATADGIIAMHKMMLSGEPGLLRGGERGAAVSEEELKKKMADPRYWRDRDPALVREVAEGFKRLYPQ
jgi:hypothetical protein